jgi:hypothetical protein
VHGYEATKLVDIGDGVVGEGSTSIIPTEKYRLSIIVISPVAFAHRRAHV